MPTYEYICSNCNNAWEEMQKISEPALEVCPKCGKPTAKRQISGGNFILKGGGWYADLYSSAKPGASSSKGDKGEGGASESKGEGGASGGKSDAKESSSAPAPAAPAPSSMSGSGESKS